MFCPYAVSVAAERNRSSPSCAPAAPTTCHWSRACRHRHRQRRSADAGRHRWWHSRVIARATSAAKTVAWSNPAWCNGALVTVATARPVPCCRILSSFERCTIGGNPGHHAAGGLRASEYVAPPGDDVLGLVAVTGTGELIRVGGAYAKCSSGFDHPPAGGQRGHAGADREATLKLAPRPQASGRPARALPRSPAAAAGVAADGSNPSCAGDAGIIPAAASRCCEATTAATCRNAGAMPGGSRWQPDTCPIFPLLAAAATATDCRHGRGVGRHRPVTSCGRHGARCHRRCARLPRQDQRGRRCR